MIESITAVDKSRFEAIRKSLDMLGSKESTFLRVELLFYEALNIAKAYGDDLQGNKLLAALRNVQAGAYQNTTVVCKTSSQKERLIHQFIVQFKKAISSKSAVL